MLLVLRLPRVRHRTLLRDSHCDDDELLALFFPLWSLGWRWRAGRFVLRISSRACSGFAADVLLVAPDLPERRADVWKVVGALGEQLRHPTTDALVNLDDELDAWRVTTPLCDCFDEVQRSSGHIKSATVSEEVEATVRRIPEPSETGTSFSSFF